MALLNSHSLGKLGEFIGKTYLCPFGRGGQGCRGGRGCWGCRGGLWGCRGHHQKRVKSHWLLFKPNVSEHLNAIRGEGEDANCQLSTSSASTLAQLLGLDQQDGHVGCQSGDTG